MFKAMLKADREKHGRATEYEIPEEEMSEQQDEIDAIVAPRNSTVATA